MANEALELYPSHPLALALTGNVYSSAKQLPKARKSYEKALQIQPECLEAVLSTVELDCEEGKWNDALIRYKHPVQTGRRRTCITDCPIEG